MDNNNLNNFDTEDATGELKKNEQMPTQNTNAPGINNYGYNNPFYNGKPLPQYMDKYQDHNGYQQRDGYQNQDTYHNPNEESSFEFRRIEEEKKRAAELRKQREKARRKAAKKAERKSNGTFKKGAKFVAAALVFGLIAGAAFQGVNYGAAYLRGDTSNNAKQVVSESAKSEDVKPQQLANTTGTTTSTLLYDVSDVSEKVMPSIVSITTTLTTTYQYWYQEYQQEQTGAGSGIIIDKTDSQLYIATNYHVVEGANEINVGFNDGEVVKAKVKGYDADADIAVVVVDFSDMKDTTANSITVASIGDSDKITVGEPAIAIGNALGYGQSVTVGYISALNRTIEDTEGTFIQTDAAINPGNSGGALIDINGQVIGINSIKYVDSSVESMGFSIPINSAMDIITGIISGNNEKVYLGITGADISAQYAQIYGFPKGIYVKEVTKDSPAEKAGIHAGDIIVEFDGQSVYTMEELQNSIKDKNEGDTVKVTMYRQDSNGSYKQQKIEVTLAKGVVG